MLKVVQHSFNIQHSEKIGFRKMKMQLRDFQQNAINNLYSQIKEGKKRIAFVSPTGSGKTIMATKIISDAISRNRKILFLVTIDCLIEQTLNKLTNFNVGVIAGKYKVKAYSDCNIFIASLQTLSRRKQWMYEHWDLLIFDEAHTSAWYGASQELLEIHQGWVIGLTATPYRLSRKQSFGDTFESAIVVSSMKQLTQDGYLSPLRYFALESDINYQNVKLSKGDYEEKELAKICNVPSAINSALDKRNSLAPNKRTLAFAVNVDHAIAIANLANERGIKANYVTGETSSSMRQYLFNQLQIGELELLSSCMALSTGFDCPPVECLLLMRRTLSRSLLIQQVGRGARISPETGKTECIVIDQGGSIIEQGILPCQIELSPEDVLEVKKQYESPTPVKSCPNCDSIQNLSAKVCDACGHEFPKPEVKERIIPTGDYVEIGDNIFKRSADQCKELYRNLLKRSYQSRRSPSEAYAKYCKECEDTEYPKPKTRWGKNAILGTHPQTSEIECFYNHVRNYADRTMKDEQWIMWILKQEFGKITSLNEWLIDNGLECF